MITYDEMITDQEKALEARHAAEAELARREKELPDWTQNLLRQFRQEHAQLRGQLDDMEAENNRLRAAVEGKAASAENADTFLVDEDTAAELPLGTGPEIAFAGFYRVRYGQHESSAGARVLVVETDSAMQIRPTDFSQQIIIAQA